MISQWTRYGGGATDYGISDRLEVVPADRSVEVHVGCGDVSREGGMMSLHSGNREL